MSLVLLLVAGHERLVAQTTNVTTAQQDTPAVCSGCVYRTGQNLTESEITHGNLSKSSFGRYCNYALDGQVYGQPLVLTNVLFSGYSQPKTVVYVVTMNDSVYAFDGAPSSPGGSCTKLVGPVGVLGTNETAANCGMLGGGVCKTIAPNIGILGTPVITTGTNGSTTTGTLYFVAESQLVSGSSTTYYHRLWAFDITSLARTSAIGLQIVPPSGCPIGNIAPFSQIHIQRPALLLGGDNYLYIAFSMMDGNTNPYPNGMILAYKTGSLGTTPLCLALSQGISLADGAGIWGGGGGPAYGPDANTGTNGNYYTFFNTANGVYDGSSNWGDSFIKMYNNPNNGSPVLQVNNSFTPGDQVFRSNPNCGGDGDTDFGSGNPMLLPDNENSPYPYLAVNGDKEGGIWFMDRTNPNGYGGGTTCTAGSNNNVQTAPIINGGTVGFGSPVIHNNPAYWENFEASQNATSYIFLSSHAKKNVSEAGAIMRYQVCDSGSPINSSANCTATGAYAYEASGTPLVFPWGTTPTVSAASTSESDAIVWAIWADGSVVPNSSALTYKNQPFPPATNGRLYAFDAASATDPNMPKL